MGASMLSYPALTIESHAADTGPLGIVCGMSHCFHADSDRGYPGLW
uniref:Uncharacterized protein n=1 Tax=Anguilla anguilla TaxID=7936 RepID=A0A0E9TZS5_ANGAN